MLIFKFPILHIGNIGSAVSKYIVSGGQKKLADLQVLGFALEFWLSGIQ
jgi:hypothetical protein